MIEKRNKLCECDGPGYCKRHKVEKTEKQFLMCACDTLVSDAHCKDAWKQWENNPVSLNLSSPHRPKERRKNSGVGTELKKFLRSLGIKADGNCACNKKAKIMDHKGPTWCRENLELIVGWLEEEAKRRRKLFSRTVAKQMVKICIRRVEKRYAKGGRTSTGKKYQTEVGA